MTIAPRDRRAVALCIGALALIALVWYGVLPWLDHWSELRGRIESADVRLGSAEAQSRRLSRQRRRVLEQYGPAAEMPLESVERTRVSFVKSAVDLVTKAGLQIKSVTPVTTQPLRDVPGVAQVSLEIQSGGQITQLVTLLASLRQADSLVLVDRLSATAGPQGPAALSFTLVLSTLAAEEPPA